MLGKKGRTMGCEGSLVVHRQWDHLRTCKIYQQLCAGVRYSRVSRVTASPRTNWPLPNPNTLPARGRGGGCTLLVFTMGIPLEELKC